MKYFYYSRVSTIGQNEARQTNNFKLHGEISRENNFLDKIKGDVCFFERPQASKLFDLVTSLKDEDFITIIVDDIDRLGRDLLDILKTIKVFTENKINLKILKQGLETLLPDRTENPIALMVTSVLGSIAEYERKKIITRTREGIAIAKANGVYKGRKFGSTQSTDRLLERHVIVVKKLKKGINVRDIALMTGKSPTTIMKVKKAVKDLS